MKKLFQLIAAVLIFGWVSLAFGQQAVCPFGSVSVAPLQGFQQNPPFVQQNACVDVVTGILSFPSLGNVLVGGTLGACSVNGAFVVGSSCYANIAAAITAAGTTGSVLIPASYAGTDVIANTNGVQIIDRRITNGSNETRFMSLLAPAFPVTNFPLGSDLVMRARGPADTYIEKLKAATTTATTLNIGANASVTVGSVLVNNTTRGTVQTGTTAILSTSAGLVIGRETANEEVVPSGSWSIVNGTTLSITCAKSHGPGTTDIEQIGSIILTGYDLFINSANFKPSQNTTYNAPLRIKDSSGNITLYAPAFINDIWPYAAYRFTTQLTGETDPVTGNNANAHFIIRNNKTSSQVLVENNANTANIFALQESGGGGIITLGNPTNTPLRMNGASSAGGFIEGGGTSSALFLFGVQTGAGTSGTIDIRNNVSDFVSQFVINGGTGLITTYRQAATAGNGVASVNGATSQKTESAADANVLTFTPPAVAGTYRISVVLSLSAANAATLGWTATWKDSNGNAKTPTNLSFIQVGTAAPALTFTTSTTDDFYGSADIDIGNTATNIVIKLTFAGTSFTGKMSATIEQII